MKPKFNFMQILKINMDILAHLEHYISEQKIFHPNIVVKIAKNRCKSAQNQYQMLVYKSENLAQKLLATH